MSVVAGSKERMFVIADQIATGNIGYNQARRWSFLGRILRVIIRGGDGDCSSISAAIAWLAGYLVDLTTDTFSGNFAAKLKAAGFSVERFRGLGMQRPGDFLVAPGAHVIFVGRDGRFLSAEADERGKATGGKPGNQTGREIRWRDPYLRGGTGWEYIVRPPTGSGPLSSSTTKVQLVVDGDFGKRTIAALQRTVGVTDDGQMGPDTRKGIQTWLGVKVDGVLGPVTIKALQSRVGAKVDGVWGSATTRALQAWLNG